MAGHRVAVPLAMLLLLALALPLEAPAFAGTTRVWTGSARSETSILGAGVGETSIAAGIESAESSNDLVRAGLGAPTANGRLTLARAAGTDIVSVGTSTTSGTDSESVPGVALNIAGLLTGDAASGSLASTVDAAGLRSILSATIGRLSALGGLVDTDVTSTGFTTAVTSASASSTKELVAGRLDVLSLGVLLDALRLDVSKLPLDSLAEILSGLGVAIPGGVDLTIPDQIADLDAAYAAMAAKRDQLAALVADPGAVAAGPGGQAAVDQALADYALVAPFSQDLLGLLGLAELPALVARYGLLPITSVDSVLTTIATAGLAAAKGVLADLDAQIQALLAALDAAIDTLAALVRQSELVSVGGIQAALSAVATQTQATSTVTGSAGAVSVGSVELVGSVDLVAPAAISSLAALLSSKLAQVAGTLGIAVPVVEVLEITKASGTDAGGYRFARAGLTALEITIPSFAVPAGLVLGGTGAPFTTPVVAVSLGTTSVFSEYKVVTVTTDDALAPAPAPAPAPTVTPEPTSSPAPSAPTPTPAVGSPSPSGPAPTPVPTLPLPLTGAAGLSAGLGILLAGSAILVRRMRRDRP